MVTPKLLIADVQSQTPVPIIVTTPLTSTGGSSIATEVPSISKMSVIPAKPGITFSCTFCAIAGNASNPIADSVATNTDHLRLHLLLHIKLLLVLQARQWLRHMPIPPLLPVFTGENVFYSCVHSQSCRRPSLPRFNFTVVRRLSPPIVTTARDKLTRVDVIVK